MEKYIVYANSENAWNTVKCEFVHIKPITDLDCGEFAMSKKEAEDLVKDLNYKDEYNNSVYFLEL